MSSGLKIILLAGAFMIGAISWAGPQSPIEVKADALKQLQEIRAKNVKRLSEIDTALDKRMKSNELYNLVSAVEALQAEKHEHLLREEFLDRLIFKIDTAYTSGDLRTFLHTALPEMATHDASSSSSSDDGLWKFLKYAAEAVDRSSEQRDDMIAFLEGYMNHSVTDPMSPDEYLATRNYSNGAVSEKGHPVSREVVGAYTERRLQQLSQQGSAPPQQLR